MPIRMPEPWRGLLLAGGLILAGTAILHIIAFPALVADLRRVGLETTWGPGLQGLWVMFSVHLGIIAGFLIMCALRPRLASDSGLLVSALLLAADTALLGGFAGLFIGTVLVGMATGVVIIARIIRQVAVASS